MQEILWVDFFFSLPESPSMQARKHIEGTLCLSHLACYRLGNGPRTKNGRFRKMAFSRFSRGSQNGRKIAGKMAGQPKCWWFSAYLALCTAILGPPPEKWLPEIFATRAIFRPSFGSGPVSILWRALPISLCCFIEVAGRQAGWLGDCKGKSGPNTLPPFAAKPRNL